MLANLIARYRAWRTRRYWAARHLEFIRTNIMTDWRWLSVHPVGKELTNRYEKLTASDWYKHSVEDIDDFRRRIGWDPHAPTVPDVSGYLAEWRGHLCTEEEAIIGIRKMFGMSSPRPHIVLVEMDNQHHAVLMELAAKRDMSPSALMNQALRIYQYDDKTDVVSAHMRALREPLLDEPGDVAP